MKFTILDTVSRVSKAGKPYTQAACKGMSKNGTPWLFIATIPAEALPGLEYSVALWVKADDWTHDKQGTNIVSKNSIADKWPFNNWGDLWVQVCPPWTDEKSGKNHPANEIMYRTMGCGGDIEGHGDMTTDGYSIPAGVWTHIMVRIWLAPLYHNRYRN